MSAAHDVQALLDRIGSPSKLAKLRLERGAFLSGVTGKSASAEAAEPAEPSARPLHLAWPRLEEVLPDGGLPKGVVELSAPHALGGSTSLALAAVRAGQSRAREAWCAWIDPEASLYAPGVVRAGVDVTRLLVVCPDRAAGAMGRTAVKVVASGAFEVVVVDVDCVDHGPVRGSRKLPRDPHGNDVGGSRMLPRDPHDPVRGSRMLPRDPHREGTAPRKRGLSPEVLVRKLALAAEPTGATVILLTDSTRPRTVPWPVALRLELSRPSRAEISVRVAKDKRGRVGVARTIPFRPLMAVS